MHPLYGWVSRPEVYSTIGHAGYMSISEFCSASSPYLVSSNTAATALTSQNTHIDQQIPRNLTFISRGLPVKIPKCETRPMTEPAVLPLQLRSSLFDSSLLRDRWPRLQFTHTSSEAAVTTVGTHLRSSGHECLYCAMPMIQVASACPKLKSIPRRSEHVNHANCRCWNGRSSLPDRTLYQRRDGPRCGAVVSIGKLTET
jgi:hypothetical protein